MIYLKNLLRVIVPLFLLIGGLIITKNLLVLFSPLVIGFIIATILNPIIRFLEKRLHIKKNFGLFIISGILVSSLGFGIYWVISELIVFLPKVYSIVITQLEQWTIPPEMINMIEMSFKTLINNAGKLLNMTSVFTGNIITSIPIFLINFLVTLLSSFLFITNYNDVKTFMDKILSKNMSKKIDIILKESKKVVDGYFLAQFKIMIVVAIIILIGFLVIGVKNVILLTIIIAILDFLPLFGAGAVLIPWIIFEILSKNYQMGISLLVIYVIIQVVRQVIQPKIFGDTIGLSPLSSLIFMYIGFLLYGFLGMIVAVPLGVLIINLIKIGLFDNLFNNIKILINDFKKFIND